MMANGGPIALLTADAADLVLGFLSPPIWGIYLNGSPVIQPATPFGAAAAAALAPIQAIASLLGGGNIVPVTASTIDFEYAADSPVSTYPQEQGAFQSYDKVTLPFDVKVKLAAGGSTSNRQAFLNSCLAIKASLALFDVVTPEMTFSSVNCVHIDWRRIATAGVTLIAVDLWFEQISVSASAGFSNTQQPGAAGVQSAGNVQPGSPQAYINQNFM